MTTPSSNRARHYARFIPREEIDDVAHWQFTEVDEKARQRAAVLAAAEKPPEPVIDEAMLQQARDEGYQLGLEQGRMEAALEGQRRLDEYITSQGTLASERLNALMASLEQRFTDAEQTVAQGVLAMACEVARQVLRRELATDPESLRPVIREALGLLAADARTAVVRLNPEDHDTFKSVPSEELGGQALKWVSDASVPVGGCLIEAAGAQVDGTLQRRWARAVANLGVDTPWSAQEEAHDAAD